MKTNKTMVEEIMEILTPFDGIPLTAEVRYVFNILPTNYPEKAIY